MLKEFSGIVLHNIVITTYIMFTNVKKKKKIVRIKYKDMTLWINPIIFDIFNMKVWEL